MKLQIGLMLLVGMLIGTAISFAVEQPTLVKMQNKQGEVIFHHEEHLSGVNDCTDCHHMGVDVGGCRDCHGANPDTPRLKHAFHRQCRNCHIKNGGPTECDTCHNVKKKVP